MRFPGTPFVCICLALFTGPAGALQLVFEAASGDDFGRPHDIVLSPDHRYLYVADNSNDRIVVLDPQSMKTVGIFGEGEVGEPHDVVFDAKGRLLVADTTNSRIAIYEVSAASGRLVDSIEGDFRRTEGVAVHPNGRIYVTGAGSDNLLVYENGSAIRNVGGLSSPHDVEVAPDGSVWVADSNADRMVRFDENLNPLQYVAGPPYNFNGPRYMDFDDKGRMYIADKYSNQVKILSPELKLILTVGTRESGMGPGVFYHPEGVEVLGDRVWFSDTYNDRIVRYRIVE